MKQMIFVTRHSGATKYMQERLGKPTKCIQHISPEDVADIKQLLEDGHSVAIYGVIPVPILIDFIEMGAETGLVVFPYMPQELRGTELNAEQMESMGAKILRIKDITVEVIN